MRKSKKFDEYDFLNLFYVEMVRLGQAYNLVKLSVTPRMIEDIYETSTVDVTEDELKKLADICLANSWLKHTALSSGQYGNLQLTTTGLGVVKSKQRQVELKSSHSNLKKASDYIEEHKGLFIFLGFVIALTGLLLKYF